MKVSVVIAYYNRRGLFIKTLESISATKHSDLEVIVVDDASQENHRIEDLQETFAHLNLKVFRVDPKKKWWRNPCMPNNIGFHLAMGDAVIIQNPECLHLGDIVSDVAASIISNKYLVYGCYALDANKTNQVSKINGGDSEAIRSVITPTNDILLDQCPHMNRWYQHSIYSHRCLNFCTAIMKKDLEDLGGFDEQYATGIGYDDTEFIARVRKKGMSIEMIDSPIVIHQWHPFTDYSGKNWDLHMKNKDIYENKTLISDSYKVNN